MCDQKEQVFETAKDFLNNETFKSCFARSVAVNSQYKLAKNQDFLTEKNAQNVEVTDSFVNKENGLKSTQETPIRYRKNNRSASMDESRRYSCGSILYRRASMVNSPRRNEIPVENIYNQNKIETLQWQLKEIEKSREMYKAVLKEVVTFLEKTHVSMEHLGHRLNRKNSVPRSKSEHHIVADSTSSIQSQRSLIEEHLSSWGLSNRPELHPDEVPPEKLSQEAFRLLRTTQSLLSTQEPKLASSENLSGSEDPSDIEFLTQLAREFRSDDQRPQRTTSFSLSPKLILPEHDVRISTAFNRKLSLQLSEVRRNSNGTDKFVRSDSARTSVAESEAFSLPPGVDGHSHCQADPLRANGADVMKNSVKNVEKTSISPATTSISSVEDESGFSSMNSFQELGLPLVNSTAVEDVSARSVLLKSMLHNNSDYSSLNESENGSCFSDTSTMKASPRPERRYEKRAEQKLRESNRSSPNEERRYSYISEERRNSLSDIKLWQKPYQNQSSVEETSVKDSTTANSQGNHQRWHSSPEKQCANQSLKVLWV